MNFRSERQRRRIMAELRGVRPLPHGATGTVASGSGASSRASADSNSGSSAPAWARRCGIARPSPMPKASSPSIGPASPCTPTFARSTPAAARRILSAGAFRARTSATPASTPASPEQRAPSGATSPAPLARFDPASCLWRTWPPSARGASTAFSGTWPRSGMMQNGIACQREPLAPLTRGTASSSSPSWPTPTGSANSDKGPSPSHLAGRHGWNLAAAASDSLRARPARPWPTPTASAGTGASRSGRQGGPNLQTAVTEQFPTPLASDYKMGANSLRYGRLALPYVVARHPTPAAHRESGASSAQPRARRSPSSPNATAVPVAPGQLSPAWVDWLMGFPIGWTDSAASATPSSPKSRSSSAGGCAP